MKHLSLNDIHCKFFYHIRFWSHCSTIEWRSHCWHCYWCDCVCRHHRSAWDLVCGHCDNLQEKILTSHEPRHWVSLAVSSVRSTWTPLHGIIAPLPVFCMASPSWMNLDSYNPVILSLFPKSCVALIQSSLLAQLSLLVKRITRTSITNSWTAAVDLKLLDMKPYPSRGFLLVLMTRNCKPNPLYEPEIVLYHEASV